MIGRNFNGFIFTSNNIRLKLMLKFSLQCCELHSITVCMDKRFLLRRMLIDEFYDN